MMYNQVVIGCDHGAVSLKNEIKNYLENRGFDVSDIGVNTEESVDYPDIAQMACKLYLAGKYAFGVLLCGTGIGISISANKVNGIRCALPQNKFSATMAKEHNDANFIAFGGRVKYQEPVLEILEAYISAEFKGDRHIRRINKMMKLEQ